jgi:hypothetical protein
VLVGVGLFSSQRDQQDKHAESQRSSDTGTKHSGSSDARTLRRSKNDDQ